MDFPRACDVAARIYAMNDRGDDEVTRYVDAKRDEYIARITSAIRTKLLECTTGAPIAVVVDIERKAVKFVPVSLYTDKVRALCTEAILPRLREAGWCIWDVDCFAYGDTEYMDGYVVVRLDIRFPVL